MMRRPVLTRLAAAALALWSFTVTAAILSGLAAALVWWAGWPLPDHWPTVDEWSAFADQPLTPAVLKALAACVGWLLWLLLASAVGAEMWLQRTRRPLRLRLPRPIQTLAAG